MNKKVPLIQKINAESKVQAFKILAVVAPSILIFTIYLTISTKISQYQQAIVASRSVMAQSLLLGDFVFIRQFTKSIASDPAISFAGIKDRTTSKWRLASELDGRDHKKELSSLRFRAHGMTFPIAIVLDDSQQFIFYLEYVFYFYQLFVPFALAAVLSVFIFFMQQNLLAGISRDLTAPVQSLAADIVNLSSLPVSNVEFRNYERGSKFLEIDVLAEELRGKIRTIRLQNEKMKEIEVLESLRRFSRQVGHDIKSPLGALRAVSMHLQGQSGKTRDLLLSSVSRIESIVDDLSKDTNNELLGFQKENFDLRETVSQLIDEKRAEFASTLESIDFRCTGDGWKVFGSSQLISRTLSNIVNNSIEACDLNSKIYISLIRQQNEIHLTIRDDGKGMSKEDQTQLFSYGFSKGKVNGSGTGLWYAKQVLEAMNGSIEVVSKIAVGTTVILKFPAL